MALWCVTAEREGRSKGYNLPNPAQILAHNNDKRKKIVFGSSEFKLKLACGVRDAGWVG